MRSDELGIRNDDPPESATLRSPRTRTSKSDTIATIIASFAPREWKKELGARDTQTLLDEVERVVSQDGVERIVDRAASRRFVKI